MTIGGSVIDQNKSSA